MKSICYSLILGIVSLGSAVLEPGRGQSAASAPPTTTNETAWQGPKLRLAVMDLTSSSSSLNNPWSTPSHSSALNNPASVPANPAGAMGLPASSDFERGLTEMLTTALVKNGHFIVIERAALDKVSAEQDLGGGGRISTATAARSGQVFGAQAIITGNITDLTYSQSSLGGTLGGLGNLAGRLGKTRVTAKVAIDLRVVDAETGEVLAAQHAEGKVTMSNVSADVLKGSHDFSAATARDTPLGEATRQAIDKAVNAIQAGMEHVSWYGRVIDVRDGNVYINAGSADGIRAAEEFVVLHPGDLLVDPETGKALGAPESRVASVTVDFVQDKFSVARVTSGGAIQRGDLVRKAANSSNGRPQ